MSLCFFISDLHGSISRYKKLFSAIQIDQPEVLLTGGNLLPHWMRPVEFGSLRIVNFTKDYLIERVSALQKQMKDHFPEILVIMGNDLDLLKFLKYDLIL